MEQTAPLPAPVAQDMEEIEVIKTGDTIVVTGETVLTGGRHPGTKLEVLSSAHGWYVGFRDKDGSPYSRESKYFRTKQGAAALLGALRDTRRD